MPRFKVSQEPFPMVIEAPDEYAAMVAYEFALDRGGTRGLLVEVSDEPVELTVDESGYPINEE